MLGATIAAPAAANDCGVIQALTADNAQDWREISLSIEESGTLAIDRLGVVDVFTGMSECNLDMVYSLWLECEWRVSSVEAGEALAAELHQRLEPCLPEAFTMQEDRQSGSDYRTSGRRRLLWEHRNESEFEISLSVRDFTTSRGEHIYSVHIDIEWDED